MNFGFSQKFSFISYSTNQGLAQSQVNDIAQDSKKYLWIATLDGLSKFNGITFKNYYTTEGLVSNTINTISIDNQDNVWAVTDQGISIVSGDSIMAFAHNKMLEDAEILEVIHHENKIWISTFQKGIYCFKKKDVITSVITSFKFWTIRENRLEISFL